MLNFIAIEFPSYDTKTRGSENVTWRLTGHNKTLLHVRVKKEAKEGGRG